MQSSKKIKIKNNNNKKTYISHWSFSDDENNHTNNNQNNRYCCYSKSKSNSNTESCSCLFVCFYVIYVLCLLCFFVYRYQHLMQCLRYMSKRMLNKHKILKEIKQTISNSNKDFTFLALIRLFNNQFQFIFHFTFLHFVFIFISFSYLLFLGRLCKRLLCFWLNKYNIQHYNLLLCNKRMDCKLIIENNKIIKYTIWFNPK